VFEGFCELLLVYSELFKKSVSCLCILAKHCDGELLLLTWVIGVHLCFGEIIHGVELEFFHVGKHLLGSFSGHGRLVVFVVVIESHLHFHHRLLEHGVVHVDLLRNNEVLLLNSVVTHTF